MSDKTTNGMTDADLISYCESHCATERALFNADQVNRMIELAGNPPEFCRVRGWVSAHEEMAELCKLARARLVTPPAMNAASPTAPAVCEGCNGHGMVSNILDQDTCPFCDGSGETTAMAGSGPDTYEMPANCLPCGGTGAISQGSATSGEAAAITPWRERGYEDEHSDVAMMAEIADLRAALAAKAEQPNTPVPRVGGITCPKCGVDRSVKACPDLSNCGMIATAYAFPGAERAAAIEIDGRTYTAAELKGRIQQLDAEAETVSQQHAAGAKRIEELEALLAERAAAPASVPEPIPTTDDYTLDDVDLARKLLTFLGYSISPSREPGADARVDHLAEKLAAWGASQRQEGRRDMHETDVALVAENCALMEKLRAARGPLAALESYCADVYANAQLRHVETAHRRADELAKLARATIKSLATPAPTTGEPSVTATNFCLLIDELLMSWLSTRGNSPENRERRLNARSALETAIKATQGGKEGGNV